MLGSTSTPVCVKSSHELYIGSFRTKTQKPDCGSPSVATQFLHPKIVIAFQMGQLKCRQEYCIGGGHLHGLKLAALRSSEHRMRHNVLSQLDTKTLCPHWDCLHNLGGHSGVIKQHFRCLCLPPLICQGQPGLKVFSTKLCLVAGTYGNI